MYHSEPRHAPVWIRGIFLLDNGTTITRTVRRDFVIQPGDDERPALVFHAFLAEIETAGWDFPEGHGTLAQLLGAMHDGNGEQ
jgi:hypothetical protein